MTKIPAKGYYKSQRKTEKNPAKEYYKKHRGKQRITALKSIIN
jgi:hypothetical protein